MKKCIDKNYIFLSNDSRATTRKAMPVHNMLPPVRKYTSIATRMAGISIRKNLTRTMMTKPIMTRITKIARIVVSMPVNPSLSSTE